MSFDHKDCPKREGLRARTTPDPPHTQLEPNSPAEMFEALAARIFSFPDIEERPSIISVPGARALWLPNCEECGPPEAFMIGCEFAHLHPPSDGSLHAALPPALAEAAIAKGWAEIHPVALTGQIPRNVVMVFGPRDPAELEIVAGMFDGSRRFAVGRDQNASPYWDVCQFSPSGPRAEGGEWAQLATASSPPPRRANCSWRRRR